MSGFDDLPGFGAPPAFLARQLQNTSAGGAGFDAPPSYRPPYTGANPTAGVLEYNSAPHQSQPPPPFGVAMAASGSLHGAGPMVGGSARHAYQIKTYDLPPVGGDSYNSNSSQLLGGASAPQQQQQQQFRSAPFAGGGGMQQQHREVTNTVWLGFQETFVSDDELRRYFGKFGKVVRLQRNDAKNCVFVHFVDVNEARAAVETPETKALLGPTVKVSYGRMFTYDAEELERMERYNQARNNRAGGGAAPRGIGFGGDADGGAADDTQQRPTRGFHEAEPSNIVWLGDVTPELTDEDIRINFEPFGRVVSVNRADSKGMAFVHFETIEQATAAIRLMRNVPIGGRLRKLNFGRPVAPRGDGRGGFADDREDREPATNVVWLGMIPPTVTQADVDALFQGYPGFIDADLFPERAYAFVHFETVEQAVACRKALRGQTLHNAPIRIGHGKQNHTRTMADRNMGGGRLGNTGGAMGQPQGPMFDQYGMPILQAPSDSWGSSGGGALITTMGPGGQLTVSLPTEGTSASNATSLVPKYVTRARPTPTITLENRVNALGGCSYFKCNVPGPYLLQPAVKDICDAVDNVTSSATGELLLRLLRRHDGVTTLPHLCAVVAKRIKDYYVSDPHKKLHVVYAVAMMLHEHPKPRAGLDAFCMLLSVTSVGLCADGAAHLARLMKSFRRYLNADDDADHLILTQMEDIEKKHRADSDLNNLLKKLQGAK